VRIYISGPMTGYPEFNYPAFRAAEHHLRNLGHDTANPARHPVQDSWAAYMRLDLADLVTCDAVAVLPDWELSRGAVLEVHVAQQLGMSVLSVDRYEETK
jgi:hypothetical protein